MRRPRDGQTIGKLPRRTVLGAVLFPPIAAVAAAPAPVDPHIAYRDRLVLAHAEAHAARPIGHDAKPGSAEANSIEATARELVMRRIFRLSETVLALPPAVTRDGLGVAAMASAILLEGTCYGALVENEWREVSLVRAALAVTGASLPPTFIGFGDEAGFRDRDRATYRGQGRVPAWALAAARRARR